jgi:outer membrane protein assembly factor BamB
VYSNGVIRTDWGARPPKILWQKDVGFGFSQFVVVGKQAVTAGYPLDQKKCFLYCLDADTGNETWKVEYADTCGGLRDGVIGPTPTPVIDGDRVYMAATMGALYCFDLKTGQKVWAVDANKDKDSGEPFGDYGDGPSPVIVGDLVIVQLTVAVDAAAWHALSKKDGRVVWTYPVEKRKPSSRQDKADRAYSCAVLCQWQGKPHVLLTSNASIDLVGLADGKKVCGVSIAEHKLTWGPFPDPAVFEGDKFLVGLWYSGKATAAAFQITGEGIKPVWSNRTLGKGTYSFVLRGGHAYGYGNDGLQCVDLADGKMKWKWRSDDSKLKIDQGEIILVGDKLVWMSTSGILYVGEAAPDKPGPLGEFKAIGKCTKDLKAEKARYHAVVCTAPSLAGDRLYCRSPWGEAVCVDMK